MEEKQIDEAEIRQDAAEATLSLIEQSVRELYLYKAGIPTLDEVLRVMRAAVLKR